MVKLGVLEPPKNRRNFRRFYVVSLNSFWSPSSQIFADKILASQLQPPAENSQSQISQKSHHLFQIFKYWFSNILQQNSKFPTFQRIMSRFDEASFNFIEKQWKEKLRDEHVEILVEIGREFYGQKLPDPDPKDISKHPPMLKIRGLSNRTEK